MDTKLSISLPRVRKGKDRTNSVSPFRVQNRAIKFNFDHHNSLKLPIFAMIMVYHETFSRVDVVSKLFPHRVLFSKKNWHVSRPV